MATNGRLNGDGVQFYAVNCLAVPEDGAKCAPVPLAFDLLDLDPDTGLSQIDLDLSNIVDRKYITMVQAVFVDNSNGTTPLQIRCSNTSQVLKVAPNRQGYLMFLCPNPPRITFLSGSGVALSVELLNFPVVNATWPSVTGA